MSSKSGSKAWVCSLGRFTLETKKDRNPAMNVQSCPCHLPAGNVSTSTVPILWQILSLCAKSLQSCLRLCDALDLSGKIHWRRDRLPTSQHSWAFLVAQLVKNPPAMWETWVRSLGWEGPLEKGMATHSSILAWRIPWTVYSMGSQRWTQLSDFHFSCIYVYTHIKFLYMCKFCVYRLCRSACGILVPWLGIEPTPLTVKVWSPNHWAAREFPIK